MKWELRAPGVRRPEGLDERIATRLAFALERFVTRIERVIVFLHDLNGPRGGVDKACRIIVRIRGCGITAAGAVDADWGVAVDRATTTLGHAVARSIDRHKPPAQRRSGRRRVPESRLPA